MRTTALLLALGVFATTATAQTFCNPNGDLAIYSNYDGGAIKIDVDMNIPNLKIGIVGYETDSIILSGTYVNNITKIWYVGYNATNNHCVVTTPTTIINAPAGTDSILFAPAATLITANGYGSIICNYSCDTTTNQGGCNTPDQIVHYFQTVFGGGNLLFHYTQYGCWTNAVALTSGGNCCIEPAGGAPLYASITASTDVLCNGDCTGQATVTGTGGTPPYTYLWSANANNQITVIATGLCAGTYTVTITDGNAGTDTAMVTITEPTALTVAASNTNDDGSCNGTAAVNPLGGTPPYSYLWDAAANNQTTAIADSLCGQSQYCVTVTDNNGCTKDTCVDVLVVGVNGPGAIPTFYIYPNPTSGIFTVRGTTEPVTVLDIYGRQVLNTTDSRVDMSSFPKGVYILKTSEAVRKLVIQ